MRVETRTIVNKYYNETDKKLFEKFAKIIKRDYENKETQRLIWEYDQKIGGLGGYAAPLNPTINPFISLEIIEMFLEVFNMLDVTCFFVIALDTL